MLRKLLLLCGAVGCFNFSYGAYWTQWRGAEGRGISQETNLLQQWPGNGPEQLWQNASLGKGYSSPIVVNGIIYITGDEDKQQMIYALNSDGSLKWKTANGFAWKQSYKGARSSCSYSNGKLYNTNAYGVLSCLNAADGKQLWSVNLLEKYQSRGGTWGIIEPTVIDNGTIYISISGKSGLAVALNQDSGEEVWVTPNTTEDDYTYSTPILAALNGVRQLISSGTKTAYGIDIKTGKLLWSFPHMFKGRMIATMPTVQSNAVFITNANAKGGVSYRIDFKDGKPEKTWEAPIGTSYAGGIIIQDNIIYGSRHQKSAGFIGINAQSGALLFEEEAAKNSGASVIFADNRIYRQESNGTTYLMSSDSKGFKIHGEFSTGKVKDFWAHPVIADGKLYLRYDNTLYCYNVSE